MLQGLLFLQTFIIPIHFLKSAPFADFSNRNLNKINILFENRHIFFGGEYHVENKKTLGYE